MDNQLEILRTQFAFLEELGFKEKPLNLYQQEFSTLGRVVLNLFNENSNRYIELASFDQSRIEIVVRRVTSYGQLNYQERKDWVGKYDIGLLTHKENFLIGNYNSYNRIGWYQDIDHIKSDLMTNRQFLCDQKWFEVKMIDSLKKHFPKIFEVEPTRSERVFLEVKSQLTEILRPYGFNFQSDNNFYPPYYSKNWIDKVIYYSPTKNVEISFGNRDYRDFTEYFHLLLGKKELLMINTNEQSSSNLIVFEIEKALNRCGHIKIGHKNNRKWWNFGDWF